MHIRYFSETIMGGYVDWLVGAGQDVQLHLHPCWLTFGDSEPALSNPVTDRCRDLGSEQLTDLIGEGAERIAKWSGSRPTCMRAGNFSVGLSVFEAMAQAGLKYSSSICIAADRPPEPELWVTGGVHDFASIRELPVTCFSDVGPVGWGRPRPMQVTALTVQEQISLLDAAHACGNPVVVIVTHPFEFVKRRDFRFTDLRPNRLVQERFRRLCGYLAANSDRFDVAPLAAAAVALDTPQPWTELTGNWLSAVARAVENGINDRVRFL